MLNSFSHYEDTKNTKVFLVILPLVGRLWRESLVVITTRMAGNDLFWIPHTISARADYHRRDAVVA